MYSHLQVCTSGREQVVAVSVMQASRLQRLGRPAEGVEHDLEGAKSREDFWTLEGNHSRGRGSAGHKNDNTFEQSHFYLRHSEQCLSSSSSKF